MSWIASTRRDTAWVMGWFESISREDLWVESPKKDHTKSNWMGHSQKTSYQAKPNGREDQSLWYNWVTSWLESMFHSFLSREFIWIKTLESFLSRNSIWIGIMESRLSHDQNRIRFLKTISSHELIWISSWKPLSVMSWVGIKTFWDWVKSNRKIESYPCLTEVTKDTGDYHRLSSDVGWEQLWTVPAPFQNLRISASLHPGTLPFWHAICVCGASYDRNSKMAEWMAEILHGYSKDSAGINGPFLQATYCTGARVTRFLSGNRNIEHFQNDLTTSKRWASHVGCWFVG